MYFLYFLILLLSVVMHLLYLCCHDPARWAGRGFSCIFPEQNRDWGSVAASSRLSLSSFAWVLGTGPAILQR